MTDVYTKPQEPIMWGGSSLYHKPHATESADSTYRKEHLDMGLVPATRKDPKIPATLEKQKIARDAPASTKNMYNGGGSGMGGRGNVRFA